MQRQGDMTSRRRKNMRTETDRLFGVWGIGPGRLSKQVNHADSLGYYMAAVGNRYTYEAPLNLQVEEERAIGLI